MDFQQLIVRRTIELSGWEKFNHYLFVWVLAGLSIMGIGFMLFSKDDASFEGASYLFAAFCSIAIIFYFIQKRRLRFIVIETTLNREHLAEVINYVSKRQKWKQKSRSKTFYVATCNDDWFLSN